MYAAIVFPSSISYHFSYADEPRPEPQYGMKVDFIDARNWHAIKHFSHFWLGIFFVVMSVLFTLKLWEIRDYTDREEVGEVHCFY